MDRRYPKGLAESLLRRQRRRAVIVKAGFASDLFGVSESDATLTARRTVVRSTPSSRAAFACPLSRDCEPPIGWAPRPRLHQLHPLRDAFITLKCGELGTTQVHRNLAKLTFDFVAVNIDTIDSIQTKVLAVI